MTLSEDPHEALLQALTLGPADPDPARFLDELLNGSKLSADDRAFLREQGPRHLLVYRRLVRNTLRELLELSIPRTVARLGALDAAPQAQLAEPSTNPSLFRRMFDAFCAERGPRSHYLRDVTTEFLDFVEARFTTGDHFPTYLLELGRLEAAEIEIAAAPSRRHGDFGITEQNLGGHRGDSLGMPEGAESASRFPNRAASNDDELSLDRGVVFSDACRLFDFEYAVHRLPNDTEDRTEPERLPTSLLVYRSPEHDVRYLELSPLAAALLRRLLSGATLRDALVLGAAEQGLPLDDAALAGAAQLLSDVAHRGVLWGAR